MKTAIKIIVLSVCFTGVAIFIYSKNNVRDTIGNISLPNPPAIDEEVMEQIFPSMHKGIAKLEREVPMWVIAHNMECWNTGHPDCETAAGAECCRKVNETFRIAEMDLHNVSIAAFKHAKWTPRYSMIEEQKPEDYKGKKELDFRGKFGYGSRMTEARIWLYMIDLYKIPVSKETKEILLGWGGGYRGSMYGRGARIAECKREKVIQKLQGNSNPYLDCNIPPQTAYCLELFKKSDFVYDTSCY